tara:strand:+ start:203 stop:454 length:252 start_codon:yes stop_codon:yes gene_type:complete
MEKIKDFIHHKCELYSITRGELLMLKNEYGLSILENVFKYRKYHLENRFELKLSLFDIFEEYSEAERVDRLELNSHYEIGNFN